MDGGTGRGTERRVNDDCTSKRENGDDERREIE